MRSKGEGRILERDTAEAPQRYFQLLEERSFAEAEKELETLKTRLTNSDWEGGYLTALEGLLLTKKNQDDKYLYLCKIDETPKTLKMLRQDFSCHAQNELHAEYDMGYFTAMTDYIRALERMPKPGESKEADLRVAK